MRLNSRTPFLPLLLAIFLPVITLFCLVSIVTAATTPPVIDLNGDLPGLAYSTTFTEDEGPEPIVAAGLFITNSEDMVLTAARATLANAPDAKAEGLWADAGSTGLEVKYSNANAELTIEGNGSIEAYEEVLRTLVYTNDLQSPDIADRIVLITVSDGALTSTPVTSTVAINAVNDAPILDNSGNMTMSAINEDDQNSGGNSVSGIVKTAEMEGQDRITDVDENNMEGIAVIEAASANGAWQYSINSGISWQPFVSVSNMSAVVLDGGARIRFLPNANFYGSASFLFRAWDQSGGRPSGKTDVDTSLNGGSTPFSVDLEMVTVNIQAVNDPPIVDLNGGQAGTNFEVQFFEGGGPVLIADPGATASDADHSSLLKMTVTLTSRPDGAAESLVTDTTGTNITSPGYDPSTGTLILNGPDTLLNYQVVLRRIAYANNSVNPTTNTRTVTIVANDGQNDGPVATTTVGVNPTNNAPVLDATAVMTMSAIVEDAVSPSGAMIADVLATGGNPITDADSGALEGIAVIGANSSHGQWQYSLVNPPAGDGSWLPVGAVSDSAALLLSDGVWLRFVPAADYFGDSGELTFRAWDRTSGTNGQRDVNVSVNGGNTAFSVNTNSVSVSINPLNDLPVLGGLPQEPVQYVEDTGPLPVPGSSLTVTDADSQLLASATVRLTNTPDGDAEWLLVTTEGTGITSSYDNGVLLLTGAASPAAYQTVLRSVKYWNTSQDPDPADRVFQVSVADNQGSRSPLTVVVQVQPVNDPPELDLNGIGAGEDFSATFFIGRGPVPIVAENLLLNDIDDTTIKSATIRIANLKNAPAEILNADLTGVTNIQRSYDPATGLLTLTGVDSIANYQRVLRTITYNNTLPEPDSTIRAIEFVLTDGTNNSEVRESLVSISEAPTVFVYLPQISWVVRRAEEPNDDCAEAMGVGLNLEESFRADDKDDWFYFDTTNSTDITVELRDFSPGAGQILVAGEKAPGQGCNGLQLINSNGSNETEKTVPLGRQPAGRYFIWIINDGSASTDAIYHLYVRTTP